MRNQQAIVLLLFLTHAILASAATPASGLYEITVTMDSANMPLPARNSTTTQCIATEDFSTDPKAFMGEQKDSGCEIDDYEIGDGQMHMTMTCDNQGGKMTMVTQGSYTDDSFSSTTEMEMAAGTMTMKMSSTSQGRRIGDC